MGADSSKMLRDATKKGDEDTVLAILAKRAELKDLNVHEGDKTGLTPLMAAAEGGHVGIVKALIAAGADVNRRYSMQNAPNVPNVRKLLPTPGNGATALAEAGRKGHVGVVAALGAAGADPNTYDTDGMRAIHRAVIAGNVAMVNELIALKADLKGVDCFGSGTGKSPIEYALLGINSEIVSNLYKQGCVPSGQFKGPSAPHVCKPLLDDGYVRLEDGSFYRGGEEPF